MVLVQKCPFFPTFFLGSIGQENVFYDILERKNAFLGYKNTKYKKSRNYDFSKEVNPWFCSEKGHFSNFFLLATIDKENAFYNILGRNNAFLSYKNTKIEKLKYFQTG